MCKQCMIYILVNNHRRGNNNQTIMSTIQTLIVTTKAIFALFLTLLTAIIDCECASMFIWGLAVGSGGGVSNNPLHSRESSFQLTRPYLSNLPPNPPCNGTLSASQS